MSHRNNMNYLDIVTALLVFNLIGFVFIKIALIIEKHHTFYSCEFENQTTIFNGKEYRDFKLKFETVYKMSPHCSLVEN